MPPDAPRPGRSAWRASPRRSGRWGRAIADPVEAFSIARRNADADDIVVVTGSTFVVATLRDWWLANVVDARRADAVARGALRVRGRLLPWGARTYVMGIVNVTPDSFSGDGVPVRRRRSRTRSGSASARRRSDRLRRRVDPARTRADRRGDRDRARLVAGARRRARRAPRARSSRSTRSSPKCSARAHAAGGDLLNSIWGLRRRAARRPRRSRRRR